MCRADNLNTFMCCLEICEPQPPGTLRACPGLYRDCFTFYQLLPISSDITPLPNMFLYRAQGQLYLRPSVIHTFGMFIRAFTVCSVSIMSFIACL
jgi:hypothetical protein